MIAFPNAKINLGLNVLSKREDGYHNISSCFYPINWCDVLEIIPSSKTNFISTGLKIEGSDEDNLCLRAYRLLEADHPLSPVNIHLHKVIPMGAGLGGGSSDAAFTLKLLNDMFNLDLSHQALEEYAAKLGSDCTFFVENKPAMVSGVGATLEPIDFSLDEYNLIVVYPNIHVPTQVAYQGIQAKQPLDSVSSILKSGINSFKEVLKNDFEQTVGNVYPEIIEIKKIMYQNEAIYASMSGSGSAVYGVFESQKGIDRIKKTFPGAYQIWNSRSQFSS